MQKQRNRARKFEQFLAIQNLKMALKKQTFHNILLKAFSYYTPRSINMIANIYPVVDPHSDILYSEESGEKAFSSML